MQKPNPLKRGDKVAIVSLSSGMLGEKSCSHNLEIAIRRLQEFGLEPVFMPNALKGLDYLNRYPQKRAEDLKAAFLDPSIQAIICAIGGNDTYRLLPYLMEDETFIQCVKQNHKLFTGFSDTTINHFMFYKLGLQTFYGPAFITDLGEIADEMLPYTKQTFERYFVDYTTWKIKPSPFWYEERTDFSKRAVGTNRMSHLELHGYELLQGQDTFSGELLGGCLESMYKMLSKQKKTDEVEIIERYSIFPSCEQWQGKVMFLETCEDQSAPALVKEMLTTIERMGAFNKLKGVLIGKPQDERYYQEYKEIYLEVFGHYDFPVLYNVNFGHATPRFALPYGAKVLVKANEQTIEFMI